MNTAQQNCSRKIEHNIDVDTHMQMNHRNSIVVLFTKEHICINNAIDDILHLQQPMKQINRQKRPPVKPLSFADTSLVLHAIAKSRGMSAMDRQSLVPWFVSFLIIPFFQSGTRNTTMTFFCWCETSY